MGQPSWLGLGACHGQLGQVTSSLWALVSSSVNVRAAVGPVTGRAAEREGTGNTEGLCAGVGQGWAQQRGDGGRRGRSRGEVGWWGVEG